MDDLQWRRVRPGLYERINTPHHVPISRRLLDAIRAESPLLARMLEAFEAKPATCAKSQTDLNRH